MFISVDDLIQELPKFFKDNSTTSKTFFEAGEIITVQKNAYLNKQFYFAEEFYMLLDGEISFSVKLDDDTGNFSVGETSNKWTPVGWSGFRYPSRYATTVQTKKDSVLIRWKHSFIKEFTDKYPAFGSQLFLFITEKGFTLLDSVRKELVKNLKANWSPIKEARTTTSKSKTKEALSVLQRSAFFEKFNGDQINLFSRLTKQKEFKRGDLIFRQGERSTGFYFLASGQIGLEYEIEGQLPALIKVLNRSGLVINWTGVSKELFNDVDVKALTNCKVYYIEDNDLKTLFEEHPSLGLKFSKRLLWLISNHLRSARSKWISLQFEHEILAVRNLLEQNSTQLSVKSSLHKIPHLLGSIYTLEDSFKIIREVLKKGTPLEKNIAQTMMDVLADIHKEQDFYTGLTNVYDSVVNAPEAMLPSEIRNLCAQKFIKLFKSVPIVISGEENLPEDSGHIFILNHLKNHPYNTLPNKFQLTLDSHFVSSMLLYRKYKDSGIRVVRVSTGAEYGHQDYYNRLGHIYVYTKDSETIVETKEEKQKRRTQFYKEAGEHLTAGRGLILSPEGTSVETHESPVEFKAGAFKLALNLDPEPYIVPIAVANFDKRMNHSCLSVVIKKPFRMSDVLKDPNDKEEFFAWLKNYRKEYRGYVEEAIAQAENHSAIKTF